MRRGSLLSQPHSVLQKLASISEGNPLAPRNSRGFLFQTLSPEKGSSTSDAPKKPVGEMAGTWNPSCSFRTKTQMDKADRISPKIWFAWTERTKMFWRVIGCTRNELMLKLVWIIDRTDDQTSFSWLNSVRLESHVSSHFNQSSDSMDSLTG